MKEQKQTEERLREAEERFRIAAETSNDLIHEWDLRQSVLWFGRIDEMLGYGPDEFPRTLDAWADSLHPEDRGRAMSAINAHLEGRAPFDIEYRVRRKDGVYRWWAARGVATRAPDGKPLRWIGTVTDITERRQAEERLCEARDTLEQRVSERTTELARSKQLLDEMGKLAQVGGWELDLKEYKLSWTDTVYQIHEIGPEYQPTVETAVSFYAPEAVPMISEAIQRAIEEGLPFDIELPLITAKGNRIWVRALGQAYRDNGEIVKVCGAIQDITMRRQAEDELKQHRDHLEELVNERNEVLAVAMRNLEHSNKDLEQFAYVASHDLQEPLRMVASYTQLLAQRYEGQLDEKAKKYIDYAVDGAVRMQRLINDLLTYSRIGTQGRQPEPIDTHSVLGEACRNLQTAIEESGAMVTDEDLPTMPADAGQILQLFQNLIGNAIKFHGADPPRVHVSAQDLGREWCFSVNDNGIGMESQYADRVFVIFQRLHTQQEYPGTGIGLAVCKRIVERHGGRIWLESRPGEGSTFFFTVPK